MRRRTTLDFDELNELDEFKQLEKQVKKAKKKASLPISIPYKDYFGKMLIEPEQMETRIDLAKQIENVMLYTFAYWLLRADSDMSEQEIKQKAKEQLRSVIARHTALDDYLDEHIDDVIDEVWETTSKYAEDDEDAEDEGAKDYWTSRDRAKLISENEANAFENYIEYRDAKAQGKTKKVWLTELDDKVRLTHELAEGQTVDIDGLFFVGDSMMRFPMDTKYDASPRETVNCRCVCKYE